MRTLRTLVATGTAGCVVIGPFARTFSMGACVGLLVCAYLWRHELWLWAHETWRRLWVAILE